MISLCLRETHARARVLKNGTFAPLGLDGGPGAYYGSVVRVSLAEVLLLLSLFQIVRT